MPDFSIASLSIFRAFDLREEHNSHELGTQGDKVTRDSAFTTAGLPCARVPALLTRLIEPAWQRHETQFGENMAPSFGQWAADER